MDFEKSISRLEEIVKHLENGDLPLEESLKDYEEGIKLSSSCQKKLSKAEHKIYILKNNLSDFEDKSLKDKKKSKNLKHENFNKNNYMDNKNDENNDLKQKIIDNNFDLFKISDSENEIDKN